MSRVLIIEDDSDIREVLGEILRDEGYDVSGAANGREALDRLANEPLPGIILLDLMMPVMNGWQFREEQLQDPELARVPVVVISADGAAQKEAEAFGAEAFLQKPIDLVALLEVVARYCPPPRRPAKAASIG